MVIRFKERNGTLIVHMSGELDHHSAEESRIRIDNKIDELGVHSILFDFSGVNFMDSSGIGVVIGRYKKVSDFGGRTGIINMKPAIKRIFEMGGLFKIIKEYKSLEEALESL